MRCEEVGGRKRTRRAPLLVADQLA
jgi:thiaminase (transcriptional activator TenA)